MRRCLPGAPPTRARRAWNRGLARARPSHLQACAMPTRLPSLVAVAVALSGCAAAPPCDGVEAGGMCWVARDGLTVTADRAQRVYDIARRHWGGTSDPEGWTVEIGLEPIVHEDRDRTGVD